MEKEKTTIRISKKAAATALDAAKNEGMKLYAWIEKTILEKVDNNEKRTIRENIENKEIICTDCCLYKAETMVTIISKDNRVKIKYLCSQCDIAEMD